jgi:hypothetical protein
MLICYNNIFKDVFVLFIMVDNGVEVRVEPILDIDEFLRNSRPVTINQDVQREILREGLNPVYNASGWGSEEAPYFP